MEITNKITIVLCALFIQSNSCTKAMETQPYQTIFHHPDIMNCVVENFDTPLTTFYNLCLTNMELYKNWNNNGFWEKITTQTGYFKKEFLDKDRSNPFLYRSLFLAMEEDIFQLMGISLHIIREENRREENKRYLPENENDFTTSDPYEIEIRTPIDPRRTLELLSKIRTREKQIDSACPLDSLSIFSLETRVKLWEAEGVFLTYLIGHSNVPEFESDKKFDLAFGYLGIIFPSELKKLSYFVDPNSKKFLKYIGLQCLHNLFPKNIQQ